MSLETKKAADDLVLILQKWMWDAPDAERLNAHRALGTLTGGIDDGLEKWRDAALDAMALRHDREERLRTVANLLHDLLQSPTVRAMPSWATVALETARKATEFEEEEQ